MTGSTHRFRDPKKAVEDQMVRFSLVRQAVFHAQVDAARALERRMVRDAPVDRGEYKAGIEVRVIRRPPRHQTRGLAKSEVRTEANAPHSGVLELGARPFMPPLQPLVEWAERKALDLGLVQRASGRFRGRASLSASERGTVLAFAKAVQRAIARRGFPPRRIMGKLQPYAVKAVDLAYRRHIRRIIRLNNAKLSGGQ